MEPRTILVEIGNSTVKVAWCSDDGTWLIERFDSFDEGLLGLPDDRPIVLIPTSPNRAEEATTLLDREGRRHSILTRAMFDEQIAGCYDTPETLGFDRVLNLSAGKGDRIVISFGTAITVDGFLDGACRFGGILPGMRPVVAALAEAVPTLPRPEITEVPDLPARSSVASVSLGLRSTLVDAPLGLAARLLVTFDRRPDQVDLVLTGGDASVLESWCHDAGYRTVTVDDALLFKGAAVLVDL